MVGHFLEAIGNRQRGFNQEQEFVSIFGRSLEKQINTQTYGERSMERSQKTRRERETSGEGMARNQVRNYAEPRRGAVMRMGRRQIHQSDGKNMWKRVTLRLLALITR